MTDELGNNYYKSGWQPSIEFDENTGKGEITYVGTDPDYKNKYDSILELSLIHISEPTRPY